MQGIITVSGTPSADRSGVSIDLNNGTFVITTDRVDYTAPWIALMPHATNGIGFWMLNDRVGISCVDTGFYSELVFECDSSTVTGTIRRGDTSVEVDVLIPPDRFSFSPGETEISFAVAFESVNSDGLNVERPSWAEDQRLALANA